MGCIVPSISPASLSTAYVGVPYNQPLTTIPPQPSNYGLVELTLRSFVAVTGSIIPSETVIGSVSGATAVIVAVQISGIITTIFVKNVVGVFSNGETLTAPSGSMTLNQIISFGAPPLWLSVSNSSPSSDGLISGTPTAVGSYTIIVYAENVNTPTCSAGIQLYEIDIQIAGVTLTPSEGDDICGSLSTALTGSGKCFHLFISGKNRWGLLVCNPLID